MKTVESIDRLQWRAEARSCPICDSRKYKKLGSRGGNAHRDGKGVRTDIVRCQNCTTIYSHPTLIPHTNPYLEHTADDYFHTHDSKDKIENGANMAKYAESVLGRSGRMLELGCGRGELLYAASNLGWYATGVEMTESFAQIARSRGLEIESASAEDCKALDKKYDVIIMAAILEHLYEPTKVLKRVGSALVSGGLLFIDVPNESSLTMKVGNLFMQARGLDWAINLSPTFPPYHVVGFSKSSLEYALTSCGFRIHTLTLLKWNNSLPKSKSLRQAIERFGFGLVQSIGSRIGMGDGICCWAIKN